MFGRVTYMALACLALKLAKAFNVCLGLSRVGDPCVLACHSSVSYGRQWWLNNGAWLQLLLFNHPLETLL